MTKRLTLAELAAWENRHDVGIPPGPLDRQTEAERLRDMIDVNVRLATEFGDIALRKINAGQLDSSAQSCADAAWHWTQAAKLHAKLEALDKPPLPPGPSAMKALGDKIMGWKG